MLNLCETLEALIAAMQAENLDYASIFSYPDGRSSIRLYRGARAFGDYLNGPAAATQELFDADHDKIHKS